DLHRKAQLLHALDLIGNDPENRANRATLIKNVGSEAAQTRDSKGHVQLVILLEPKDLVVVENAVNHFLRHFRLEHLLLGAHQLPIHSNHGWSPGGNMEVGPVSLD